MTAAATPPKSRWSWLWRLALAALLGGTAWSAYSWYRSRSTTSLPPPPSRTLRFLNTQPGVAYVGSERCGECHVAEATTYAEHPMGRSVRPASHMLPKQLKAAPSFEAAGLLHAVERHGDKVWHREALPGADPAVEIAAEVAFAIGSGQQGQSFLIHSDGRFYQSSISWYVGAKSWNLSPGYNQRHHHFNRTINESCLFCHCNEAHGKADTINAFEPKTLHLQPIGCERCHGPGALHVAAQENGSGEDNLARTIVNPRRLPPRLREAVCEQCHLQGESRIVRAGASVWSYRPGLPFDQFVSVFVTPPEGAGKHKAVSHVEQMHQSRCFQASEGRMGCISCHDPHVLPRESERVAWYRGRCLRCHEENSCRLALEERHAQSPADSCIDCHMPQGASANIAHTSITDHRIVRRPVKADDGAFGELPLIRFHFDPADASDPAVRRDLGLALGELAEASKEEAQRWRLAHQACLFLKPAVEYLPSDVAAWEALGQAQWRDHRPREALDSLDTALRHAPRRELALQNAALVALDFHDLKRSIAYWDRLLALNPDTWRGHAYRGQALALRQDWNRAVEACDSALRIDPFESQVRMLLIDCLIHQDQRRRARDEFKILMALHPPQPEEVRKWFNETMSRGKPAEPRP